MPCAQHHDIVPALISASIVICTHDRVDCLRRALDAALTEADACDAEVLVVDNASSDDTPTLLARALRDAPRRLRVVREPTLGLSAARNRGLAEAHGPLVVFLDDDAIPRTGWLGALLEPYGSNDAACVGGRIRLHFPTGRPAWLSDAFLPSLSAYDLGDRPRRIAGEPATLYPYGANISFRRDLALRLGGFSTQMGLAGRVGLQQEETDLCYRVERAGGAIHYAPDAIVDHWIFAERLEPAWFLKRSWLHGRSNAIFQLRNRGLRPALGVWRWHYVRLLREASSGGQGADGQLLAACRRREAIGYLIGLGAGFFHLRALRRDMLGEAA